MVRCIRIVPFTDRQAGFSCDEMTAHRNDSTLAPRFRAIVPQKAPEWPSVPQVLCDARAELWKRYQFADHTTERAGRQVRHHWAGLHRSLNGRIVTSRRFSGTLQTHPYRPYFRAASTSAWMFSAGVSVPSAKPGPRMKPLSGAMMAMASAEGVLDLLRGARGEQRVVDGAEEAGLALAGLFGFAHIGLVVDLQHLSAGCDEVG